MSETALNITVADGATTPTRANPTDAGLDLYAHGDHVLDQGVSQFVDTGISTAIPEGFVGKLIARSSLYNNCNGAMLVNGVGVIDADYRGTIKAHIVTFSEGGTVILNGDKIVQLVLVPIITPTINIVTELPDTERGAGGFGSTGN